MKIGFIGFGNMANAIAKGISLNNIVEAEKICVYDIDLNARKRAETFGFTVCESENEIVINAEFIFLCVKPQHFTQLFDKIKCDISEKNILLSIAAGISIDSIEKKIGQAAIIRAMPNTPLLLGAGTVALCKNNIVSDEDYNFIAAIFKSVGTVHNIPENLFDEIINVSASSPAYIYLIAKIVSEYAQSIGIDSKQALEMFCNTMIGSAKMLTHTPYSPDELINMVASKGGTTRAALDEFEANGLKQCLIGGFDACLKRAKELNI